jgi:hypothetical protein
MDTQLKDGLKTACEGLYYISETDAPFTVVDRIAEEGEPSETRSFEAFFAPLIAIRPGHQEQQIERAKKFLELKSLLEGSLHDLVVYKFGEVRRRIYVIGRDKDGELLGLRTESVET